MRISTMCRAALSGVVVAAVALSGSPPALAAPAGAATATGTISGRLTTSAGAGAEGAWIGLYDDDDYGFVGGTTTESDGSYAFGAVTPGSYLIEFAPQNGPNQFYRQKSDMWEADPVTVAEDANVTANDQLLPTGVLTGRLRTAAGDPVTDLYVRAYGDNGEWSGGLTDADGRYRLDARPGRYVVSFQPIPDSSQDQYIPGKLDSEAAGRFEVRADAETVADDTVLPIGSLSGKFTDQVGEPLSGVDVAVQTSDGHPAADGGRTNANGVFQVPALLAGTYQVGFTIGEQTQYFRGKLRARDADPVVVRGGESTRITDRQLATGSIRITAIDAVTGAPVANFCVESVCGSGTVTLPNLTKGPHDLYIYTKDNSYHHKDLTDVWVGAGTTTERTVKLRPAAVITTTVVDRATGRPVADVCVAAFLPKQARLVDGYGYCSDRDGRIRVGLLDTGEYRLFVDPFGSRYGRQWVGPDGGTGDEREAAVVATTAGQTVAAPQIKLDRAGTVTGRVTDAATGEPIENAFVSVLTAHPGVGASDATTDADGRYTLERLGPYRWPVETHAFDSVAPQWSGGAPSRYTATPVTVTAGASAAHDVTLAAGSEVTGTFTNADGVPFEGVYVIARTAETGDIAGVALMEDGQFTMRVTGPQRVYFTYNVTFQDEGEDYDGKYTVTNPDGTKTVPRFSVPANGTLTVGLVVPTG